MLDYIKLSKNILENADAILVGAGSGLSTSAGLSYVGRRFEENFYEYITKYGMKDMYTAGFYPFETLEEKWGYWSKHIYLNRFESDEPLELYKILKKVLINKNYFVITTNVDGQFKKANFDMEKFFEVQGNYGEFQCSIPCNNTIYDNRKYIVEMVNSIKDLKVSDKLIPKCLICCNFLISHLRIDNRFVENDIWKLQFKRYHNFIEQNKDKNIVFLELGVGNNTPSIIKFPFRRMNKNFKNSHLIKINMDCETSFEKMYYL